MMSSNPDPNMAQSETIEVVRDAESTGRWSPVVGPETLGLMDYFRSVQSLNEESRASLQTEAHSILSRCVPPDATVDTETGLVVGYVQSGKTMSYTVASDQDHELITSFNLARFEKYELTGEKGAASVGH
jgi:hypothetical protein